MDFRGIPMRYRDLAKLHFGLQKRRHRSTGSREQLGSGSAQKSAPWRSQSGFSFLILKLRLRLINWLESSKQTLHGTVVAEHLGLRGSMSSNIMSRNHPQMARDGGSAALFFQEKSEKSVSIALGPAGDSASPRSVESHVESRVRSVQSGLSEESLSPRSTRAARPKGDDGKENNKKLLVAFCY